MLFQQRFWPGIADGSVTLTFRRWKRPVVVAGRPYRTAAGIVEVTSVTTVDPEEITDADARRAGYESADALRADLRGEPGDPVTRVEFRRRTGPDPRAELAATSRLRRADVEDIDRRLDRLDRASTHGPWTATTLALIAAHPAVRAGDLAEIAGRPMQPFKTDVRKLKNLGLTLSLDVGYRLSPRGRAYLRATQRRRS